MLICWGAQHGCGSGGDPEGVHQISVLRRPLESTLDAAVEMLDQTGTGTLALDRHQ
jgi:hypothetical protein